MFQQKLKKISCICYNRSNINNKFIRRATNSFNFSSSPKANLCALQVSPSTFVGFTFRPTLRLQPIGFANKTSVAKRKSTQRFNFTQSNNKQIFGTINYKNIGILRNLINLEGKILSQRITRLASKKQRQTAKAIKCSRVLGLLPFVHKTPPFKRKLRVRNFRNRSRNSMRARRNTRRV